jgi:glutaconate CoA-transferase subunit B
VPKLDFVTSIGHGEGGDHRARLGTEDQGSRRVSSPTSVCSSPTPRPRK